jgi:serine protease
MRVSRLFMYLSLAMFANALGASAELNPVRSHPATPSETAVQGVIVKLRAPEPTSSAQPAAPADAVAALATRASLGLKESHRIAENLHVMHVLPAAAGEAIAATIARLRADPEVIFAEPDRRRYIHAVPNDPLYLDQWYLHSASTTPSAVDAEMAWEVTTGSNGIVIADIDTGVRFEHPDLLRADAGDSGRLLPGYDFVSDLSIANDGDGRDADPSDPGDWVTTADTNTPEFKGCMVADSSWHGTRVVGMLGAITDNATGVAGLTWSSWILPVRALGKCGGNDSDIESAMLWAAGIHVDGVPDNPYPAKIENLSIGAPGSCPASYQDVIEQLTQRGVLIVVSAGNDGGPVAAPANCPGVAAVAGLRQAGTKVGYSNLGPEIALGAPAGNCGTTAAGAPCLYTLDTTYNLGTTTPTTSSYTDQTNANLGTSFSAPIVSGIAALMLAVNGNLKSSALITRLREGAQPFPQTSLDSTSSQPTPTCHVPASSTDVQNAECICTLDDTTCGAGMANAFAAVAAALRPIAAVAVPTTVTAGGNVVLRAAGSAAACNHTITGYQWVSSDPASHPVSSANAAATTVTAPTSGSFTVTLTVLDDSMPKRTDVATVTVSAAATTTSAPSSAGSKACLTAVAVESPVVVSVSPPSASLQVGTGTQAFKATVTDTTNSAVSWGVNNVAGGNSTVGTISTSGVYTPPATVSATLTVTVTATSVAVKTQSASAQVTVIAPPSRGGGGGGIDALTLLTALLMLVTRTRVLRLSLSHSLRSIEPFFLRPAVMRRRNTRLLEKLARNLARFFALTFGCQQLHKPRCRLRAREARRDDAVFLECFGLVAFALKGARI